MAPKNTPANELSDLVGRAQELQDEANQRYTAKEAKQAAAELGIAPAYVDAALAEKARRPPASPPRSLSWVLALCVCLPVVGTFSWWVWGTVVVVTIQEETTRVVPGVDEKLEKAFASQLELLEESRAIIGGEAAALDELVVKFHAKADPQEKIAIMLRLNRGLHDPVFFKSPIGNAKAESILQENSRLHTLFFFAKEH